MPELPEVETVCRGLEKALLGARVTKVDVHRADLRFPLPKNLALSLKGAQVLSIKRRAKYILMNLDNDETLLLHLGMSGRMVVEKGAYHSRNKEKHDHLVFHFNNGTYVRFNDPRRFGVCDIVKSSKLSQHKLIRHLGPEPLDQKLTTEYLFTKLKTKKTSIKIALLDQRVIVGVGNIYASEALFRAGIHPERMASTCKPDEIEKLLASVRNVLKAAIKAGGSSLRDYVQADGELGYFQHQFAVYDCEGKPCPDCHCKIAKTGGIQRITQGGRSSFYCPLKQI